MSKKAALITGITGQDGSYLAEFLLEKGYDVYGMIRLKSGENFQRIEHLLDKIELIPNHINPTQGDQWETYGEEYEEVKKAAKENRVITALDTGGGISFAMGWHYVNRIYYHITSR